MFFDRSTLDPSHLALVATTVARCKPRAYTSNMRHVPANDSFYLPGANVLGVSLIFLFGHVVASVCFIVFACLLWFDPGVR